MKKHLIFALCFCIIITFIFSGCSQAQAPPSQENTTQESKPQASNEDKKSTEVVRRINIMADLADVYLDYPLT